MGLMRPWLLSLLVIAGCATRPAPIQIDDATCRRVGMCASIPEPIRAWQLSHHFCYDLEGWYPCVRPMLGTVRGR